MRTFPIFGIRVETPYKLKKNIFDFTYKPSVSLILSPGKSNSEKISNEDSSLHTYNANNEITLNRYSGSDKLDNSKRLVSSFTANNDNLKMNLSQSYEFTDNSNFHKDSGNYENLGNLLGGLKFNNLIPVILIILYDKLMKVNILLKLKKHYFKKLF